MLEAAAFFDLLRRHALRFRSLVDAADQTGAASQRNLCQRQRRHKAPKPKNAHHRRLPRKFLRNCRNLRTILRKEQLCPPDRHSLQGCQIRPADQRHFPYSPLAQRGKNSPLVEPHAVPGQHSRFQRIGNS